MVTYRSRLPQLGDELFLTDGGIETTLIFHEGIDLPHFAAFTLLRDEPGREALRRYFRPYLALAGEHGTGFILESPTWRASRDWAARLGYDERATIEANRTAVALCAELRAAHAGHPRPIVVSGCIGPRGDGYVAGERMSADEAEAFHVLQVEAFAASEADMVTSITMTYAAEAIGIVRAARAVGMPVAISFTVETDGALPSGQPLGEAIAEVDATTEGATAYFMLNCAHPTHFARTLAEGGTWRERIGGLRVNASACSHAELNEATELDVGDPAQLAEEHAALRALLPNLRVLGGCCGTDHRHVDAIARALVRR